MNEPIEEAEGMCKTFGTTVALAGVDIRADAARPHLPWAWKGVSP
jgi:hypothetical protein